MALFGGPAQPTSRLEELKRLLLKDPTSRQFLALAEEYRRHGKYRDAVITLERGLALHSTSVAGHVALGRTYQQLDRLEDAIRAFNHALRIDRENLVAIRQLAEVYLAKGEKVEAIKKLKLYRGLKAGDREVNEIIARLEDEMSAAVGERSGFRSGVVPAIPPPPASASSSTTRRAALLRRLDVHASEPQTPVAPAAAKSAEPMALTYDGISIARAVDKVQSTETSTRAPQAPPVYPPAPPAPPEPPAADIFLQTAPPPEEPRASSGEIPPFTEPIRQVRESELAPPVPELAPPPPPPPPSPPIDLDDVPTAPFEFPVHLYRVGSAPEPEPPARVEPPPVVFEPAPAPEPPAPPATEPPPLVTETLAEVYERQGFVADARETYRTLAESEEDAEKARALHEKAAALPSAERVDWPHLRRLARRFPKREPATANDLTAIIRGLVESTEGIRAATLTDLEGLPVVTVGPGAREMSQEILVAELTSFLKRVDRAAPEVGVGDLRSLVFDGEKGTAVVSRVNDDYSLILHVDPGAILGEVRWETERAARALGPAVR